MPDGLPQDIAQALRASLGVTVKSAHALRGGMINQAARVETSDGVLFVKWRLDAPNGMFAAEAAGLAALAATGAIRIPQVLAVGEMVPFLATEYLEATPVSDAARFARLLGEQLAALHRTTANNSPLCGFDSDNFIGIFPQQNKSRTDSWAAFYREYRLLPQIARAHDASLLPARRAQVLERVIKQLDVLMDDLPPQMSLIHGDLWAGNLLCFADDTPVLIDPAVYYGPREMEIAYMELFGGFPDGWRDIYDACFPLPQNYTNRRPLHQIYPLLVHLNCFGERYGPAVERACNDALAAT